MKTKTTLNSLYSFPGFRALSKLKGILGDSPSRIVTLRRRKKKQPALYAAIPSAVIMTRVFTECVTWIAAGHGFIWSFPTLGSCAGAARR